MEVNAMVLKPISRIYQERTQFLLFLMGQNSHTIKTIT